MAEHTDTESVMGAESVKIVVAIFHPYCFISPVFSARVAELVDAHDSGSCGGNPVEVRFLSRAP